MSRQKQGSCSPILKRASVVIWAALFSPVQSIGAPPQSSAIHRKLQVQGFHGAPLAARRLGGAPV
ncbi:hypothetical protein FOA52_013757 [Chlamydomonas sp. UWO 241]|nr:hypothetical protein FOA52_013757 [Chlamydomonas sp. UWO 241]